MNGYQIIQEIAERSGGVWKPSPGSIYPTLQQLEDEGLVRAHEQDGKRVYTLTDEGRAEAERRLAQAPPWVSEGPNFRESIKGLALAYRQVVAAGTAEQVDQANQILVDARKQLYRLLAED